MSTEVASAYVSITAQTGGLQSGLTAADARLRAFSANADRTASRTGAAWGRMGRVMRTGALVGAAGVVAGFASAVKTASDFEQQMAQLRAVTGAGTRDMDRFRDSALDLGAATKFSAGEVAAAQVELAKAGMNTAQVLGGSLQGSLALAAAGGMELDAAASAIVNTMGQFGLAAKDASMIADGLAEAANATTADVGDMAMALENVGPSAKAAGLDFRQTVVALEMLAKSGTMGAEAGTNMRSMLNALANPTAKAQKAMRALGLEFFDSSGRMKDIDVISGDLQRAFAGLTNEQRLQAAASIAGQYGQKALLSIMEGGPRVAREFERGLNRQGQAARTAATMNDTLAGKVEQLGGALETIQIKVGSALIPVLADTAVAGANMLEAFGESQQLEAFAAGAADALAGFASAAGEAWSIAQPLLQQLGGIGADAFVGLSAAAQGAAPVLMTVATAVGGVAQGVLAVVGPVVSLASGLAQIPGVATGATAAIVGFGAAMLALKAATAGTAIASSVTAFMSLAAGVRSASSAAALAGATFPRLAASIGFIASPAGAAALGIGALAAGIALLAANSGPTVLQTMASELDRVAGAANAAKGAVSGFTTAAGAMKDADIELAAARAGLMAAEENLARVRANGASTAAEVAQAESGVEQATRRVDKARQASAQAQREVVKQGLNGVVALARLTTESGRVNKNLGDLRRGSDSVAQAFGISSQAAQRITQEQIKLAQSGANVDQRMNALRKSFAETAQSIDTSTKAGREAKTTLEAVADLDNAGLVRFAGSLQDLERQGVPPAKAVTQALEEATKPRTARMNARDDASPTIDTVTRNALGIPQTRTVTINAVDNATGTIGGVLSLLSAIPTSRTTTVTTVRRTRTEDSMSSNSMDFDGRPRPADTTAFDRQIKALEANLARLEAARERAARRGMNSQQRRDADRAAQIQRSGDRLSALEAARQAKIDRARDNAEKQADQARARLEAIRDRAFTAFSAGVLGAFDRETQGLLAGIASTYEDGFTKIGDTFSLVPGLFTQLSERTKAASAGLRAALDADLAAINSRAKQLTKSEQALADLQSGKKQADLQQAVLDAEAALLASNGRDVQQRLKELEDAKFALKVDALEKQAAAERAATDEQAERERTAAQSRYDEQVAALERSAEAERLFLQSQLEANRQNLSDQRDVERTSLQVRLDQLQENFKKGGALWGRNHQLLLNQTRTFAEGFEASGRRLGRSYADGLVAAYPALRRAASGAASIIADFLKLNSPADKGPLSTLDKWWRPFGDTLTSGVDMREAALLVAKYADPGRGGSSSPDFGELAAALRENTAALMRRQGSGGESSAGFLAPPSSDSLVNLGVGA